MPVGTPLQNPSTMHSRQAILSALLSLVFLASTVSGFIRPMGFSTAGSVAKSVAGVSGGRAVARGRSTVMGAIKQVTGEELEKELSEWGTPIVLDVYAQWCGPCQILAGELENVSKLYGDKIRMLKVDSDAEPRIASALKVYGLPTIFFMKEGQLVYRVEGALPASDITNLINEHLFGNTSPGK